MKSNHRQLVADMLGSLYEQVDHLPKPLLNALAPALAQAQREVEKDLRAWLAREDGAARFTTQRLRRALVQVRRTMERVKKIVDPTIMQGLRIGANAAGQLATAHVTFELERFGSLFGETAGVPALDQAAVLARGEKLLAHRFRSSTATYNREMRARIGAELAVSKLRGETVDEAGSRLSRALNSVFRGERYRADRLARTELMHAYNVQHAESCAQLREQDPGIRMRWDAYFDRRTCLQCASLDGQLLDPAKKGGAFASSWTSKSGKAFKGTHGVPPAHPNCRCVLVAWRADWDDDAFRHDGGFRQSPAGQALTTVREAPLPHGFERPPTDGPRVPIVRGMPAFGQVNPDGLYAVSIEDLRKAGIFAMPGGGEDAERMARVRRVWRAGGRTPPLSLVVGPDGRIGVDDGRHRLLTALRGGPRIPRTMLIKLDRAAPGAFQGLVRLK